MRQRYAALQARFRSCFSQALRSKPGLNGRFFFDITYGTDGNVSAVKANDRTTPELRGGELERCLISVIKSSQFGDPKSPPATPVTFTLPVQLTSQ